MGYLPFRQIPQGGGDTVYPQPFDVNIIFQGDAAFASVSPGTVNGVFPNNWMQTFSIPLNSTVFGYIQAETNGISVTNVELKFDSSYDPSQIPVNAALPNSFQYAFAICISGAANRTMGGGSIIAWGNEQYIKDKTTPLQPGELPYDTFNQWIVQAEGDPRLIRGN